MSQLKAKQLKLTAAGDLLIGGTGGTGTTISATGNTDKILRIVSGAPSWSVNDHLVSTTGFNTITATDGTGIVFSVANAAGNAATKLLTFASGSASDENLKVTSTAGNITISAAGTATDVNVVIAPQGAGDVIIGTTGGGIIQSDDAQDLKLQGGNGGGNLFLLGGGIVSNVNGGVAGKIYYATDATDATKEIATIGAVATAVAAIVLTPVASTFVGTDTFTLLPKAQVASIRAFINGTLVEPALYNFTAGAVVFTGSLPYTLDANDKVVFNYVTTA